MKCKIVYLKPRNSFKNPLRSDTLFGSLCWAISMIHGNQKLDDLLKGYHEKDLAFPFFISSAFPYLIKEENPICFLPLPIEPVKTTDVIADSFKNERLKLRQWKKAGKRTYTNVEHFEYSYCSGKAPNLVAVAPKIEVLPITHNTIDRVIGGTLSINDHGQLFHTNEYFLKPKQANKQKQQAGLYFLLKGDDQLLEGPLRFLEHYGIGGDRSTGRGRFDISAIKDFELKEPDEANAVMALSLYYPTEKERTFYQNVEDRVLNYKLVERKGWKALQKGSQKLPHLLFKEGSLFPPLPWNEDLLYGESPKAGVHDAGYDITRYGFGFMIKIKIP